MKLTAFLPTVVGIAFGAGACNALASGPAERPIRGLARTSLLQQIEPVGPNLVDNKPTYWAHSDARATYSYASGVHEVAIRQTGPRPYGVQFYWPQSRRISGKRLRLAFAARSTSKSVIVVKCQGEHAPYALLGLEKVVQTTEEWAQHSFDFDVPRVAHSIATPLFFLGDVPGTVSIRGVSLKLLPSEPPRPIKSEADVFDWYDSYIARFRAGDADQIVAAWSPGYTERSGKAKPKRTRQEEADHLDDQANWKGKFSNGPYHVCVKALAVSGDTISVDGYTGGSWRQLNEKGEILDNGFTYSSYFRDTWKRSSDQWLLVKRVLSDESVNYMNKALIESLEAGHKKLRKKYKG